MPTVTGTTELTEYFVAIGASFDDRPVIDLSAFRQEIRDVLGASDQIAMRVNERGHGLHCVVNTEAVDAFTDALFGAAGAFGVNFELGQVTQDTGLSARSPFEICKNPSLSREDAYEHAL